MKENIPNKLEDHRFNISPESMEMMKDFRKMFFEVKEKCPELEAISFFGSRIRGQEKKESDLDFVIIKDPRNTKDDETEPEFDEILNHSLKKYYEKKNLKIPERSFFSAFNIDDIEESLKSISKWRKLDSEQDDFFDSIYMDIISPFLLSVGNIYEIREKILNALEKEEGGEILFQELMKQLERLERSSSGYKNQAQLPSYEYPKTIAEGKKYFLSHKKVE